MVNIGGISTYFIAKQPGRGRPPDALAACAAAAWLVTATAAAAAPQIINQPFSAKPGDIVSLMGSGFGAAPKVYFRPSKATATATLATKTSDDGTVVIEIPKTNAFDLYELWVSDGSTTSNHVRLNAPKPQHFDDAEIASGQHVRVFGRNLYVNGVAPTVNLIDVQTKAVLKATVSTASSNAYCLDIVPAAGVVAGHTYQFSVSNGYATALSEASIVGHAAGTDHFSIGQPWAFDFFYQDGPGYTAGVKGTNLADHHLFNVKTDATLKILAKGDGKTDDGPAIQSAIYAAATYGGVVYLPAGTYKIGSYINLAPGVVLQGQATLSSKIVFGLPGGFIVQNGAGMQGLADLTIQNTDLTSTSFNLKSWGKPINKFFIQRVAWNLGTGNSLSFTGDRIAILNSSFSQSINYQLGSPADKTGGLGPFFVSNVSNLQFKNNTIKWATNQNLMNDLVNAVVENNHFTRSASDTIIAGPAQTSWSWPFPTKKPVAMGEKVSRQMGRQLSINFGKNVVVQKNTFDVSDGTLLTNQFDGETILNEAGGQNMREDFGSVTAADSSSVTDNSRCSGCAWEVYPNSMLVIVSGAGAGQWRHITAQGGNTFTVDTPFDVTPAPGDHFSITAPGYENAIIANNTASGNPVGIALCHGAYINVSIIGNQLTNNGGIYVMSEQQLVLSGHEPGFDTTRNIEINGNTLTNTTGLWPSYITLHYLMINPNFFWGKSMMGIEIRNNKITARSGTPLFMYTEGYKMLTAFQAYPAPYTETGAGSMYGTVFQGNSCVNCAVNYTLMTGAIDTTIWNAVTTNSPGFVSTFVQDTPMLKNSASTSIRTVIGND